MGFETFESKQKRTDKKNAREHLGNLSVKKSIPTPGIKPKLPELDMIPVDTQEEYVTPKIIGKHSARESNSDDSLNEHIDNLDISFGNNSIESDTDVSPESIDDMSEKFYEIDTENVLSEKHISESLTEPEHPLEANIPNKKTKTSDGKKDVKFHQTLKFAKHIDPEIAEKIETNINQYGSYQVVPGEKVSRTWINNVFQKFKNRFKKNVEPKKINEFLDDQLKPSRWEKIDDEIADHEELIAKHNTSYSAPENEIKQNSESGWEQVNMQEYKNERDADQKKKLDRDYKY